MAVEQDDVNKDKQDNNNVNNMNGDANNKEDANKKIEAPKESTENRPEEKYRHKIIHKEIIHKSAKSPWMRVSIILSVLLILSLFLNAYGSAFGAGNALSSSVAANKALDYINNNLLTPGSKATVLETKEVSNVYQMKLNVDNKQYDSYITKDGSILFISGIKINEAQNLPVSNNQGTTGKIEVSVDDDPSIGPASAPVTIVEFSDFQCPFCGKAEPTIKQILDAYGDNIRFVYRDFPLSFHANAQKAAEAAECADEQGKFWGYHDKLYANQNALDANSLKQYASSLGLDAKKFNECMDSGKYVSEVQKDISDGQKYGVSGTPAFFINGKLISGAQPFEAFKSTIDSELRGVQ